MKITILSFEHQKESDKVCAVLRAGGHACSVIETPKALLDKLKGDVCDLLLVCVPTSGRDVLTCLRAAKEATSGSLPVLALLDASLCFPEDVAEWGAAGLDDYLTLPVRRSDLLLRVNVLLRRAWPDKMGRAQLRMDAFVFDSISGTLRRNGEVITLTHKEFELAMMFFRHLNQPLSRTTLLETLWSKEPDASSRTVDTHVSRVRNKLGLQNDPAFRIVPVYGYGYVLEKLGSGGS
ncbi:MAG: DNA-binding response regulator [Oxalobacter sp.]|nr:MAG: DNA-binding response regulator [Oxalobacter sp.]